MHHANLLIGSDMRAFLVLEPYFTPGPDIHHILKDTLTIDDVRGLIEQASTRPVGANEKVFIISVRTVNHEAQHALLKILEEPPVYVRIYLIVQQANHLLPTVRSRLVLLESDVSVTESNEFQNFLTLSYKERLAMIAERTKAKDMSWIDAVAVSAEAYAHQNVLKQFNLAQVAVLVARYRTLRGSSLKMLLEEIALTLP